MCQGQQGDAGQRWQACIILVTDDCGKVVDLAHTSGYGNAQLGKVTAQSVDRLGALPNQQVPCLQEHSRSLLADGLERHETHRWSAYSFAYRLSVCRVILSSFDIRLHIGRRDQPNVMSESPDLSCPVMSAAARLQ